MARYSLAALDAILLLVLSALLAFRLAASLRESSARAEAAPRGGRFVRAGDVDVFVQEMGPADGPAVVLVHGTGAWGAIWHPTMRALADAGFRSVAIDMPPFGFSERPAEASYDDQAQGRRIVGVIDALKLSRVSLVGHSFGARATMAAYFTASTFTNPLLTRRLLRQLIRDPADATDATVAMLQQPFSVQGSTAALGEWLVPFLLADESAPSSIRSLYETLATPTLVLWGEDDTVTPLAQGQDLARLIPGARLVALPQTGHIPAIEDATRFNDALVAFLSEQRSAPD